MTLDMIGLPTTQAEDEMCSIEPNRGELSPRDRLVVALDKPTRADAQKLVDAIGDKAGVYKIGLELAVNGGLDFARALQDSGHEVFLDLKMLDIPNTIKKSVANVARSGCHFLTVHALDRKTLDAAVDGRDSVGSKLKLLGVTVLTSLDADDLREQGISYESALELGVRRAVMACEAGFAGVIASGHEAQAIRDATNPDFIIKVPGIRLEHSADDQKRAMTPSRAIRNGATYLVVGRPIADAENPAEATEQFTREIDRALRSD